MKIQKVISCIFCFFPIMSFAWQPCMPFCDSACGGVALQGLGSSVASAMQSQASSNQNLLTAINDVTQSSVDFGVDMTDAWTSSSMDILSGLDARTSKIELAQAMQIKAYELSTDTINNIFVQSLREQYTARKVSENNLLFSENAMPETGEIGAIAALEFKEAYLKTHLHADETTKNQIHYGEEITPGDISIAQNKKISKSDEIFNSAKLYCEKTLSNEELNNFQVLISYITNPNPLPQYSANDLSSPKGQDYELNRKIYNAKVSIVSAIVYELISHRAQFSSPDWVRSYVDRSSNEPKLSITETFSSLVNGRTTSEGWYLNTKLMNETGLKRELTYLESERNALLFLLTQRREWRNQLLSIIALGNISKTGEELERTKI
ncbi:hypothetical protein [Microbulbifer epialgicus]|uniref:LPP20 lipoprotein n=1 Tax=Microbulbifer epialgicus TaxID=393907 RepID=A0ABV4NTV7_9GAMM